jgi:GntR family transcriptional repressor for pyruvate dehydrogenase complex
MNTKNIKLKALNVRKKLYEEIVLQIESLIEKGELKIGDRLPPERKLAEIFKVSRNPVREAIRALEERKLLQSRPGDGTYVILKEKDSLIEGLASAIQSEREKMHEIFEFRRMVEPQICSLAAKNATDEDIQKLKEIIKSHNEETQQGNDGIEEDKRFHLSIAKASKNSIFLKTVYLLNDILNESRSEYLQSEERQKISLKGHQEIFKAIEKRNSELASKRMYEHLERLEQIIFRPNGAMKTDGKSKRIYA